MGHKKHPPKKCKNKNLGKTVAKNMTDSKLKY